MKTRPTYGVVATLRGKLVESMEDADNAKTQKARAEFLARAYAYGTSLQTLRASGYDWPDGIAPRDVGMLPHKGTDAARRFLGSSHIDILGATDDPPVLRDEDEGNGPLRVEAQTGGDVFSKVLDPIVAR